MKLFLDIIGWPCVVLSVFGLMAAACWILIGIDTPSTDLPSRVSAFSTGGLLFIESAVLFVLGLWLCDQ